jgi:hypothetical protein
MMKLRLLILIELVWWAITAVVVFAVMWPIWNAGIQWPFQTWNIVAIVALITGSRLIFQLKYNFIFKKQILKAAIMIAMIPVAFATISYLNSFMVFIEEQTWDVLTGALPLKKKTALESYIWNEMLFFSVGTLIVIPVLAGRLMMSIWKQHNNRVDEL